MPANPVSGAGYLLQGIRLINHPGLRRFVLIPLLINISVFSAAIYYGYSQFKAFLIWMQDQIPDWLYWLEWVLWPVFGIAIVVLVFYTFSLVANLIAAPFNSLLAEKVELHLTGKPLDQGGGLKKSLLELVPTLIDELGKLIYTLLWAIPFLVLFFIPGINLAAPLLWFLYSAWMLAVEYVDYPMGNHGLKFQEMRAQLRARRMLSLSFGATCVGLTMIPVVNFIAMPSAVAGATAMWVREFARRDKTQCQAEVDSGKQV